MGSAFAVSLMQGRPLRSSGSDGARRVDADGQPAAGHPDAQRSPSATSAGSRTSAPSAALDDRVAAFQGGGGARGRRRARGRARGRARRSRRGRPGCGGPGCAAPRRPPRGRAAGRGAASTGPAAHRLEPALLLLEPGGQQRAGRVRSPSTSRRCSPDPGTIRCAASVGVAARTSATWSTRVVSVSWPTAVTTGVRVAAIARHEPLVGEGQQVLDGAAAAGDDDDLDVGVGVQAAQPVDDVRRRLRPWTAQLNISKRTAGHRRRAVTRTSRSAALSRPVMTPTSAGRNGSGRLRAASKSPSAASRRGSARSAPAVRRARRPGSRWRAARRSRGRRSSRGRPRTTTRAPSVSSDRAAPRRPGGR